MDSRAQKPNKSKTGKKSPCDQHTSPTAKPPEPDTSYARGGRVKKTGAAKLHKDEVVLPVAVVAAINIRGRKPIVDRIVGDPFGRAVRYRASDTT